MAIGTDTPYTHPAADGAAIGSATHRDFGVLLAGDRTQWAASINVGRRHDPSVSESGVGGLQPVTLWAASHSELDFVHYRPRVNVVERPHAMRRQATLNTGITS
jgi:hypothetical protein